MNTQNLIFEQPEQLHCRYFDAGVCRSCTLLPIPYPQQLSDKELRCRELLPQVPESDWLPSSTAGDRGFRNRAKLVVGGVVGDVTLGILGTDGRGVDLSECAIQSPGITAVLPAITAFLNSTGLPPYDVAARTGELKYVHVTEAPARPANRAVDRLTGADFSAERSVSHTAGAPGAPGAPGAAGAADLMVRVVGRTQRTLDVVRSRLSALRTAVPHARVITVNLLPEHRAALEGEREEVLFGVTLPMDLDAVTLHLRPQSFFQTNTGVAQDLYRQVHDWVGLVNPASLWDLYCGVGGFALHCTAPGRDVVGVEVSAAAVESATRSAGDAGVNARFVAADATAFALHAAPAELPEMLIVNPPRRGIGPQLAEWIERSELHHVIYSSCNPQSLAADLAQMPSYRVRIARLFDMFPHTAHLEVAVLLESISER